MLSNVLRTVFLCFVFVIVADSNHFLGGIITWRIQNVSNNGTSVAILITQTYSWTYIVGSCNDSSITDNLAVANAGNGTLSCSPSCPSGFGNVSTLSYCTDVSPLNGIAIGQRLDTVIIPTGSNFFVIYSSSTWNSHISGANWWSVTSHINTVRRPDNNMFNNAPVVGVMSPVNIQVNQTTTIYVSVSDADADMMRCRWASNNTLNGVDECASVCPPNSLPANTILNSNCTIIITGLIVNAMYAVAIVVEDFINASSTSPLSSVPVQFIVKVTAPPSCPTLPEVIYTAPSCVPVTVSQTFTSQLLGINHCGVNDNISDIATLSFAGMYQSSLTMLNSSYYYKNLTWTPTITQLGYQVMCAMALSSLNMQSTQYCFTFYVTENGRQTCSGVTNNSTTTAMILTSTTTTTATILTSTTTTTATILTSTTTTTAMILTSTTTTTTQTSIDWAVIGSISALVFLLAIVYSNCILYRYYKLTSSKCRLKFYNNSSPDNASSLVSTRIQSPTDGSVVYTVENETGNESAILPILFVDEKVADDDVEQIFEPRILYPRNNRVQIRSAESVLSTQSNGASIKMRNETVYVKSVPLPIEKMITETRSSQIETIDLLPISAKLEQLLETSGKSFEPTGIFQAKQTNVTQSKDKAFYTSNISEVPVDQAPKTKVKHKKSPVIHATIKGPSRKKR